VNLADSSRETMADSSSVFAPDFFGMPQIADGTRVEARYATDELYFSGELLRTNAKTFTVKFDDGSVEDDILPHHIMEFARTQVHEDEEVKVVDGHTDVDGTVMDVRLLIFQASPQLYQSAVILNSDGSFHWDRMAFEITQVFMLALGLLPGPAGGGGLRLAMVGGGSGVLPMGIQQHWPQRVDTQDVVELSGPVLGAAKAHFGLAESESLRLHHADGYAFVEGAPENSYDAVMVDAANADAPACDGEGNEHVIEAPPACFVESGFLNVAAPRALRDGGALIVNVIAGRAALQVRDPAPPPNTH
jgi:hypothetical protein